MEIKHILKMPGIIMLPLILSTLFSCSGNKQKSEQFINSGNIYELSIEKIVEYQNFYEEDTLLVKTIVLTFRDDIHYHTTTPNYKEVWIFEYDDNNQRIKETHYDCSDGPMELTYIKETCGDLEKITRLSEDGTTSFRHTKYDLQGNIVYSRDSTDLSISPEALSYLGLDADEYAIESINDEYYSEYDDQNRIIRTERRDYGKNETWVHRYTYETSEDTVIQYGLMDDTLSIMEKTIKSTNDTSEISETFSYDLPDYTLSSYSKEIQTSYDSLKIYEAYSYDLPGYILSSYDKKIIYDINNYIEIFDYGTFTDSIFVSDGKRIKEVFHSAMLKVIIYEYDMYGNPKKETHYTQLYENE
ncbi:MAG: hypothetical protein LBV72_13370 [Tannerella sp.]|jgi:hypothetical protein|nr:hypothetical protein [Tannerella sp.]